MNPLHRQRNVPPAGSRLITKAGYREELHPRGYHGRFIGSTLKPRGGRHEVVAKGSGETIGHISKVDRRLNIRPVTRERYHVAVHRGEHVGNFDTRANAHAEISERERLHQGLGPSVEHAQLKRVNENIMMEKGSRTIANANAARLQRQALNSRLTPEGRSKAHADRAKHLDRAQEASRKLEDFHQEQKYLQGKLIKEGGKTKLNLDEPKPARETGQGKPEVHAHQVGTIVERKPGSGEEYPPNPGRRQQFKVLESRPEGAILSVPISGGPVPRRTLGTHVIPHDQLEAVPPHEVRGASNNELAQHERNLRGGNSMADYISGRLGELSSAQENVDALRQAAVEAGARKTDNPTPEPSNTPYSHDALRAAFHGPRESLDHHQPLIPVSPSDFVQGNTSPVFGALANMGEYNDFSPYKTHRALADAGQRGDITHMMFGRESSPAIYATPKSPEAAKRVVAGFKRAGADEIHTTREGNIRAWWD